MGGRQHAGGRASGCKAPDREGMVLPTSLSPCSSLRAAACCCCLRAAPACCSCFLAAAAAAACVLLLMLLRAAALLLLRAAAACVPHRQPHGLQRTQDRHAARHPGSSRLCRTRCKACRRRFDWPSRRAGPQPWCSALRPCIPSCRVTPPAGPGQTLARPGPPCPGRQAPSGTVTGACDSKSWFHFKPPTAGERHATCSCGKDRVRTQKRSAK